VSWVYQFDERAVKDLKKLDPSVQREIIAYLDKRIVGPADPRRFGKAPRAELSGLWRYRVGDCRIVCQLRDRELIVLVIAVGHRKTIYG